MKQLTRVVVFALLFLTGSFCAVPQAMAQTELGVQRVATSSGTFLKIGLDPRGVALGGAYNAIVSGPQATFLNPAGILDPEGMNRAHLSYMKWPGDIDMGSVAYGTPFDALQGQLAIGLAFASTSFDETSEFYPQGTGRTVSYSDVLATLSFARLFTDRLTIGASVKFFREDLASNVGGPVTNGLLFDAGTIYQLGFRNSRIAITLSHFGPDLEPTGDFFSSVSGADVEYAAFSPPTLFNLSFAIDAMTRGEHRFTVASQIVHPSDQNETLLLGGEYWFQDSYALRSGYDFAADEFGFSAGLGAKFRFGGREGVFDYAYTNGGNLEDVHRVGMGFAL